MGIGTGVQWTDHTWNPWQGCTKVSPACQHCYMFRDMKRYGKDPTAVRRSSPGTFNLPLSQDKKGLFKIQPGAKVFTCSWSDWFHEAADPWRPDAWDIIRQRPDVIFQLVTKRTDRIQQCLPPDWGEGWGNVWLVATTENQEWLEKRIDDLVKVPAVVHGLSVEPMLGSIDLRGNLPSERMLRWVRPMISMIDWVIVGGESGPDSRLMHPYWVSDLLSQCLKANVAFFFKQWGEFEYFQIEKGPQAHVPGILWDGTETAFSIDETEIWQLKPQTWERVPGLPVDAVGFRKVGTNQSGRTLNGREWSQFPRVGKAV